MTSSRQRPTKNRISEYQFAFLGESARISSSGWMISDGNESSMKAKTQWKVYYVETSRNNKLCSTELAFVMHASRTAINPSTTLKSIFSLLNRKSFHNYISTERWNEGCVCMRKSSVRQKHWDRRISPTQIIGNSEFSATPGGTILIASRINLRRSDMKANACQHTHPSSVFRENYRQIKVSK